jgi:hypothetical protein
MLNGLCVIEKALLIELDSEQRLAPNVWKGFMYIVMSINQRTSPHCYNFRSLS